MIKKEKKIINKAIVPSFFPCMYPVQIITTYDNKKEPTILVPAKNNHTCTKEINLFFLTKRIFKKIVKKKNTYKLGLNYHRCMIHPLDCVY